MEQSTVLKSSEGQLSDLYRESLDMGRKSGWHGE